MLRRHRSFPLAPARRPWLLAGLCLCLAACGTAQRRPVIDRDEPTSVTPVPAASASRRPAAAPKSFSATKRGGGFYQDDGPGENQPPPEVLDAIPDAEPKYEPLNRFANKPYSVLGRDYVPMTALGHYKAQGIGSWYGRKFHGQKTSSGEIYDMYGMTAAHATLPIPSYVRVTNPANGKSVVVRINDRGPFHVDRLIDLSYAAAWKLGYIGNGSTLLDVESVQPGSPPPLGLATQMASVGEDPLARMVRRVEQATAPSPAPSPAPLAELKDSHGVFLQLGAFSNPDNAESFKTHLGRELGGLLEIADIGDKLKVQARAGIYRVQLGPWQDHAEAQRVADRLREAFEFKPVLVRQ